MTQHYSDEATRQYDTEGTANVNENDITLQTKIWQTTPWPALVKATVPLGKHQSHQIGVFYTDEAYTDPTNTLSSSAVLFSVNT